MTKIIKKGAITFLLLFLAYQGVATGKAYHRVVTDDPSVWEPQINALVQEQEQLTGKQSSADILFVGSSTIRMFYDLELLFPQHKVKKIGFGGAKIKDVDYFKEKIIYPYKPEIVAFYLGANDILYREHTSIDNLTTDMEALIIAVNKALPNTTIALIALRPIDNSDYFNKFDTYNAQLKNLEKLSERIFFVDANQILQDPQRQAKKQYLHFDGLHLKPEGYQAWGESLAPAILALL